jgi:hypothetical protein
MLRFKISEEFHAVGHHNSHLPLARWCLAIYLRHFRPSFVPLASEFLLNYCKSIILDPQQAQKARGFICGRKRSESWAARPRWKNGICLRLARVRTGCRRPSCALALLTNAWRKEIRILGGRLQGWGDGIARPAEVKQTGYISLYSSYFCISVTPVTVASSQRP